MNLAKKIQTLVEQGQVIRYIPVGNNKYRVELRDPQADPNSEKITKQILGLLHIREG